MQSFGDEDPGQTPADLLMLLNYKMVSECPVLVVDRIVRSKEMFSVDSKGEVYCKPRILFINNKNNLKNLKQIFIL
jgi:hypothetical protein